MSPTLTYKPAYAGLFLSLTLALTCNSFLDIQYGTFGAEVLSWSIIFAVTLFVGVLQSNSSGTFGKKIQVAVLIVGLLATVFFFFPRWGIPRAGIYVLAMLQAANNCVTTTRRHLHLGLLVSAAMVSFAATHSRADWTMLFYLIPYVCAVVFTLVSEQINQRATDARHDGIAAIKSKGQGVAVMVASVAILVLTTLFYWATPQVTWQYLHWRYGQTSNLFGNDGTDGGGGKTGDRDGAGGQSSGDQRKSQQPSELKGDVTVSISPGELNVPLARGPWPTAKEMRAAADRKGMPGWQAGAINKLADAGEGVNELMQSLSSVFSKDSARTANKEGDPTGSKVGGKSDGTLKASDAGTPKNEEGGGAGGPPPPPPDPFDFLPWLLAAIAAYLIARSNFGLWVRTRFDYLWLGLPPFSHAQNDATSRDYYSAMERLMRLHRTPRRATVNAYEYQGELAQRFSSIRDEVAEITSHFERERYGCESEAAGPQALRTAYRRLYQKARSLSVGWLSLRSDE